MSKNTEKKWIIETHYPVDNFDTQKVDTIKKNKKREAYINLETWEKDLRAWKNSPVDEFFAAAEQADQYFESFDDENSEVDNVLDVFEDDGSKNENRFGEDEQANLTPPHWEWDGDIADQAKWPNRDLRRA